MQSGTIADSYGLQEGNGTETADGEQAYTQTVLKGKKTWIRLPREE